ncbi:MAG: hypothetical protein ACRD1S_15775 [Vicinamibacterales bacterium]
MSAERFDIPPLVDLTAELERAFIDEYLVSHGYDPLTIAALPVDVQKALLREACLYASVKLAEVEARSHYVHDIHGH